MGRQAGRQSLLMCVIAVTTAVLIVLTGLTGAPAWALVQAPEIDPVLLEVLQAAGLDQLIEAVVTFDHYPTANDLAAVEATGVEVVPFRVLPMVGVRGTTSQILGLFGLPGLRSIYDNGQLTYFLDESVPLVGADRVWNELEYTGRGVAVAIIDSGIDATHLDLPFGEKVIQNVKVGPDLFGSGPIVVENLSNTDTTSGHGTHVASTAAGTGAALAGKYRGVAIGAKLVGVGAGEALAVLTALQAFDWVLANRDTYGIKVISNSWGTRGSFSPDHPINVASKMAHDAGLVVVFSAGNAGPNTNTLNPFCVAPWVICVAAGHKDGRTLADFSSRGIPGDPLYHPTITAPGVDIAAARATTGIVVNTFFVVDLIDIGTDAVYYAVASGTSMATPHVSGTIALMLEADPGLTLDLVKSLLEKTATPMPGYGQHEVGAGYLNAFEAVRAARPVMRFEEGAAAYAPAGAWFTPTSASTGVALSGDSAQASAVAGATATFTFTGTGVSWIGFQCERCGIARVFVDGALAATVDTFSPTRDPASSPMFTTSGLPAGSHTLVIEVTGTSNPASGAAFVVVDAFDVTS